MKGAGLSHLRTVASVSVKMCFAEIAASPGRTFLTSLGIFLGVASLLVNISFVRAMDDDVRENMERIGGVTIVEVSTKRPETALDRAQFRRSPGLSWSDAQVLVRDIDAVQDVLVDRDAGFQRIQAEGRQGFARVKGIGDIFFGAYNYELLAGRFFTASDVAGERRVAVLGMRVAERLGSSPEALLGKTVTVMGIAVEVIGFVRTESGYSRRAFELLLPYTTLDAKVGSVSDATNRFSLLLYPGTAGKEVGAAITRTLTRQHRGVVDFEIEANEDKIAEMRSAAVGMKVLLWSIATISLLVGSVSIMNIMFASIGDRIREIGVRLALGARKADILLQFLIEAVVVSMAGGIPGALLGAVVTLAPEGTFPFSPRLSGADFVLGIGFTILSGVCSGLFPALRAAHLSAVEALRY